MNEQWGVDLENLTYYRGDTHYLVMTAKKESLLKYGVLLADYPKGKQLVQASNVNKELLKQYVLSIARSELLNFEFELEFAPTAHGDDDVSIFDFTKKHYSVLPSKILPSAYAHRRRLFVALLGDALIEPFFPLGTGANRAFLSAVDAAYTFHTMLSDPDRRLVAASTAAADGTGLIDSTDGQSLDCDLVFEECMIEYALEMHDSSYHCLKQSLADHLHDANSPSFMPEPATRYKFYRRKSLPRAKTYIAHYNDDKSKSTTTGVMIASR